MAIENLENGGTVFTGNDTRNFQFLVLRRALSGEVRFGMKMCRGNVAATIRSLTGLTAKNKATLLAQFDAWMVERGFQPLK